MAVNLLHLHNKDALVPPACCLLRGSTDTRTCAVRTFSLLPLAALQWSPQWGCVGSQPVAPQCCNAPCMGGNLNPYALGQGREALGLYSRDRTSYSAPEKSRTALDKVPATKGQNMMVAHQGSTRCPPLTMTFLPWGSVSLPFPSFSLQKQDDLRAEAVYLSPYKFCCCPVFHPTEKKENPGTDPAMRHRPVLMTAVPSPHPSSLLGLLGVAQTSTLTTLLQKKQQLQNLQGCS